TVESWVFGIWKEHFGFVVLPIRRGEGGRILVDDLDIAHIGRTDLLTKLTIIPQDATSGRHPAIHIGCLRRYQDAEIYEALRRVHLI
ncbi:hypothetical protein FIBSPDRAFT_941920, partial [Athelia psychrophila]